MIIRPFVLSVVPVNGKRALPGAGTITRLTPGLPNRRPGLEIIAIAG